MVSSTTWGLRAWWQLHSGGQHCHWASCRPALFQNQVPLTMPFSTPPLLSAARFSLSVMSWCAGSTSTAFSKGRKPCSSRGSGGRTRTTT